MRNSSSSFAIEVEVEAESCLFVVSQPMLCVLAYQISKDDKISLVSR